MLWFFGLKQDLKNRLDIHFQRLEMGTFGINAEKCKCTKYED